ncbi:hypothetical protein MNBD_NITROSPINAE02-1137 [hydrothermal vent metagenome]|uniref:Cytochrome c domain-containing protein n=1 Tax=hydrothermal vent metagenome TaxID=652676 RepID=A0A3B1BVJ8_9ZZZZ
MINIKQALALLIIPLSVATSFTANAQENKAPMDHGKMEGMKDSGHKMDHGKDHDMTLGSGKKMKMHEGHNMGLKADLAMGKMVYDMTCFYCHGAEGKGDGPTAVFIGPYSAPRPRVFIYGVFKFKSTGSGELPLEIDLMKTVRDGIPGFMPSFRGLGREKLRQVVLYVSQFYKDIDDEDTPKQIAINHSVDFTRESILRGEKLFTEMKCFQCHGAEGRGDGPSADTLKDELGFPIKPADLSRPSSFKNGADHEDIYRTLMTGLTGTPMPSYAGVFRGKEYQVWDIVHYVISLAPEGEWMRMGRTK